MTKREYNKAYRAKHLQTLKASHKRYYTAHAERLRERERQRRRGNPQLAKIRDRAQYQKYRLKKLSQKHDYYLSNRNVKREYNRAYYKRNSELLRLKHKEWVGRNRAQINAKNCAYAKANPEKRRQSKHNFLLHEWKRCPEHLKGLAI